ncbi:MAG: TonB-dependent receptor [Porticoccaceae bacterium]
MKKLFVAVLAVAGLPAAVSAQDQHTSELNEVIVSASPLEENAAGINQAVSVLSGEELRNKAAATIGESLKDEPGVTSSGFGPGVGKPVIRGQTGGRVRVMQDSLGTMDASTASGDHSIATEALVAERIEVLRGPATLRYGNGAIGGVVNVIDNRIPDEVPKEIRGAVEYRHNTANDQNSNVFLLEGGKGNWAWHLDGMYRDSNDLEVEGYAQKPEPGELPDEHMSHGFITNTDTQAQSATGGLSWVGDDGFVGISISRTENLYGIPTAEHGHDADPDAEPEMVRIDMDQTRVDLKGEWTDVFPGFELGRFRLGYNDYEHVEIEGGAKGTKFTNEAFEGRVELLHQEIAGWSGAIGTQFEDRTYAAIGEEAFIPKSDIQQGGIFWTGETNMGDWSYELGLRLDRQTIDPHGESEISHNTQSLSARALWQFSDEQSLSFALTRAQRAPLVEELLSNGPHHASESFDLGDRNLDEETSHNFEVGYRYEGPVTLSLNLFYNAIDDFIFKKNTGVIDLDEELPIYQFQQEDATFRGFEASLGIPVGDRWEVELFSDYVRAKLDKSGDVPRIPPLRYGVALDYTAYSWSAGMRLTQASEQSHAGEFEDDTDAYTRLDAHVHYHIDTASGEWLLFVKGTNLLDDDIRNSTSYLRDIAPESALSLELGARFSF